MIVNCLNFESNKEKVLRELSSTPDCSKVLLIINSTNLNTHQILGRTLLTFRNLSIFYDLSKYKNVAKVLSFYPNKRDLKLRHAWNVESLDWLRDYPNLESLNLEGINPAGKDLSVLSRLPKLKELTVLKITKGIEVLADCKALEKLTLHSISTDDVEFLRCHSTLWWLSIVLGGIKNFDALTETKLKYLELYQVRGLADIGFIGDIARLEFLYLTKLKEVKKLPDFSALKRLRRVSLSQMKGIIDPSPLLEAQAMEELIVQDFGHVEPEVFKPLAKHPKLRRGAVRLGSTKKNEAVAKLLPLGENFGPFTFSDETSN
jgi:hypothetical protein